MRSIRLSLIVYFLLLLIAAESVAFWLVYRSAQNASGVISFGIDERGAISCVCGRTGVLA